MVKGSLRRLKLKKPWLIITIAVLVIFLARPVSAICTPEGSENLTGTLIQAVAEPIYSFTVPSNAEIIYPDTEAVIGDLVVGDLFLASGEWLTVTVIPGRMTKTDNSGLMLPYNIYCYPPIILNASNSGDTYGITVKINNHEFANAAVGRYKASLLFQVISHPDEKIVWEGTTIVTAKKRGVFDETEEPVETITPGEIESPSVTESPGETAGPEETASPETTPSPGGEALSPHTGNIIILWGLAVVVSALLFLLLIFWSAVVPVESEIMKNADGTYTIIWGYNNRRHRKYKVSQADSKITVLAGAILKAELIKPSENMAIPPIEFEKGKIQAAFKTVVQEGSIIQWKIKRRKKKVDLNRIIK